MGDMIIQPTSTTSLVILLPTYGFSNTKVLGKVDVRAKTGALFSYIQGSFTRVVLPETWVTSSNRTHINSWWESKTDLEFFEGGGSSSFLTVRITGDTEPYPSFVEPYFQEFYIGELILETI